MLEFTTGDGMQLTSAKTSQIEATQMEIPHPIRVRQQSPSWTRDINQMKANLFNARSETAVVLYPPEATPGLTDEERRTIAEMMAKGSYATLILATPDLESTFEHLQTSDTEVVQEPTEQPLWGTRLRRPRPCGQSDSHSGGASQWLRENP